MTRPTPFPCGGTGQPACPPTPAAVINGVEYWTRDQVELYGHMNYEKSKKDRSKDEQ